MEPGICILTLQVIFMQSNWEMIVYLSHCTNFHDNMSLFRKSSHKRIPVSFHMPCLHMNERIHAQLCTTLCNPMDYSLPGSSVHGISQARILEWASISLSRGSSWIRDRTHDSFIGWQILYHWATCGSNLILWRKWENINEKQPEKRHQPQLSS